MKGPPKIMRLNAVPAYLQGKYGMTIHPRTVRKWTTRGLRNETLETRQVKNKYPTHSSPMVRVTTDEWVDLFLQRCGMKP